MSDKPENPPAAPHVSSEEKETDKVPSDTTTDIEKTSSKENFTNTTQKKRKKRTTEEILEEIRREKTKKEEAKTPPPNSPPPPQKRVKVTASDDEDDDDEAPSFWRGAVAKPLLLAGLGGLTFFVNHWFKTTTKTTPKPQYVQPVKQQKHLQPAAAMWKQPAAPPSVNNVQVKLPQIQGFSN